MLENEEMIVASHRYREVTGSNPVEVVNFFRASLRNCINCIYCDDHVFIFISFPQFIDGLFHISLTKGCLLEVEFREKCTMLKTQHLKFGHF